MKRKNILLFQPSVGYMDDMRTSPSLPLSLLHAASQTCREYEVNIVDQRIEKNWRKIAESKIDGNTILAGVTSLTGRMILQGIGFSKYIKNNFNIPVVWGGIHPSMVPYQTLENPYLDFVVEGEGEIPLLRLARSLEKNIPIKNIPGLWYKRSGRPVLSAPRQYLNPEDIKPAPYDLVDVKKYLPEYNTRKSFYFQSSRGCPQSCAYCYNCMYSGRRWRAMSAEKTISELEKVLAEFPQVQDIYFVDDNFFIDMARARRIARYFSGKDVTWQVQGVDILSLKKMDDDFFALLQSSGCTRLTLGVESGSPRIRKIMDKKGSVKDIIEAVRRLKKFEIIIYCSFLMGIPGERKKDIKNSIDLLLELMSINPNVRNSPFYLYTPYPGTRLYDEVVRRGRNAFPGKLEDWADCEWDSLNTRVSGTYYKPLSFVSLFADRKTMEYTDSFIVRFLARLYRPLAVWRMKHFFFSFMIEKIFFDIFTGGHTKTGLKRRERRING